MSDLAVAVESMIQLANSACAVAAVIRSEISIPFLGNSEPGFELRCPISKRDALAAHLAELERPGGHFKFPHLWPLKFPQAGRADYEPLAVLSAMRAAASLRR